MYEIIKNDAITPEKLIFLVIVLMSLYLNSLKRTVNKTNISCSTPIISYNGTADINIDIRYEYLSADLFIKYHPFHIAVSMNNVYQTVHID